MPSLGKFYALPLAYESSPGPTCLLCRFCAYICLNCMGIARYCNRFGIDTYLSLFTIQSLKIPQYSVGCSLYIKSVSFVVNIKVDEQTTATIKFRYCINVICMFTEIERGTECWMHRARIHERFFASWKTYIDGAMRARGRNRPGPFQTREKSTIYTTITVWIRAIAMMIYHGPAGIDPLCFVIAPFLPPSVNEFIMSNRTQRMDESERRSSLSLWRWEAF